MILAWGKLLYSKSSSLRADLSPSRKDTNLPPLQNNTSIRTQNGWSKNSQEETLNKWADQRNISAWMKEADRKQREKLKLHTVHLNVIDFVGFSWIPSWCCLNLPYCKTICVMWKYIFLFMLHSQSNMWCL